MINIRLLSISTCALALAFGASAPVYHLALSKPAVVSGIEFKAGSYKVELNGNTATVTNGKTSVETEVTVETNASKFTQTSACCLGEDGKYDLHELRIGGTTTKLTFKDSAKERTSVVGR